jgi:hypothetical protein
VRKADNLPPSRNLGALTWNRVGLFRRVMGQLYILFIIIIGGILVLFICITRLASKEIFSPSNKIHWEEGRAKDLSAPLYSTQNPITHVCKIEKKSPRERSYDDNFPENTATYC